MYVRLSWIRISAKGKLNNTNGNNKLIRQYSIPQWVAWPKGTCFSNFDRNVKMFSIEENDLLLLDF